MSLEIDANELYEEISTGHDEIDLADWLGIPIAGQPADVEYLENFRMPAGGDDEMAAAPADPE
eukprot:6915896-Pyramimonas_sp.AAC.2